MARESTSPRRWRGLPAPCSAPAGGKAPGLGVMARASGPPPAEGCGPPGLPFPWVLSRKQPSGPAVVKSGEPVKLPWVHSWLAKMTTEGCVKKMGRWRRRRWAVDVLLREIVFSFGCRVQGYTASVCLCPCRSCTVKISEPSKG